MHIHIAYSVANLLSIMSLENLKILQFIISLFVIVLYNAGVKSWWVLCV